MFCVNSSEHVDGKAGTDKISRQKKRDCTFEV